MNSLIKSKVQKVLDTIRDNGGEAYLVGGCVRDLILKREPNDYDITTNLLPNEIKEIFKKENIPVISIGDGERHLTVVVMIDGHQIEVTTFRKETDYSDGRHPDAVIPAESIQEDLSRRDFTMNAIASKNTDISLDDLVDPYGGFEDINKQCIRCVGNPKDRFEEDKLRALRAIRFASQLGFDIDSLTFKELATISLEQISRERIQVEIIKIFSSNHPIKAIEMLKETGLLHQIIPEFTDTFTIEGGNYHNETVWEHSLLTLKECIKHTSDWRLRFTCFLHDIGKPATMTKEDNIVHFINHENAGAGIAEQIMRRLKFSNEDIGYVKRMVRYHMITYGKNMQGELSKKSIKKVVRDVGENKLWDMMILNYCDDKANLKSHTISFNAYLNKKTIWFKWQEIKKSDSALQVTDLAVNGHDMMKLGYTGKMIGDIMKDMLNAVDNDLLKNNKQDLIDYADKKKSFFIMEEKK